MKRFNPVIAIVGILVVLIAFFAVFAYFDWVIGLWVNNPYVDSPARNSWNTLYWTVLAVAMLMVGVSSAAIVKLALPGRVIGNKLSVAILFSTAMMILGNVEDWLYYILGSHSIPAWNTNMNWLYEASLNHGYWFTWQLAISSTILLFVVLPIGLFVIFRYGFKK